MNITPLCKIAYKYGTDKCPQIRHTYTPFYYQFLKNKRKTIMKVLELGIDRGASLHMWREFFPQAQIYGADIRPKTLFASERISTYLCDERKKEDLKNLITKTGNDIDLIIDDASHDFYDQLLACQTLMPLLKKEAIYIIEEASFSRKIVAALDQYECWVPPIAKQNASNQLIVIRNK